MKKILFLNGGPGSDIRESIMACEESGRYEVLEIDDLYDYSEKLRELPKLDPDILVIQTTGTYIEHQETLLEEFFNLNWLPKTVAFWTEMSLMAYLDTARLLKPHGVKICFLPHECDIEDGTEEWEEVSWV